MELTISIYQYTGDEILLNSWYFPDNQGYPMNLTLDDYRHALLASPYLSDQIRNSLLQKEQDGYDNPDGVDFLGNLNTFSGKSLYIQFEASYTGRMYGGGGGGIMVTGINKQKKDILSYPLVSRVEIEHTGSGISGFSRDTWGTERLNRIMTNKGSAWFATGNILKWEKNQGEGATQVKTSFTEHEIQNSDEIRFKIFPDGYGELLVIPQVTIRYGNDLFPGGGKVKVFFEKNNKDISNGQVLSGEAHIELSDNQIISFRNLSHREMDTIVLRKVSPISLPSPQTSPL